MNHGSRLDFMTSTLHSRAIARTCGGPMKPSARSAATPAPATPVRPRPPRAVVMGVSGSGKTTVGQALADRLGVEYAGADAFHPAANIAKMSAGVPLDDDDRAPWLAAIARFLAEHA